MRNYLSSFVVLALASITCSAVNPGAPGVPQTTAVVSTYARLPLLFEANQGQLPAGESFVARGPGYQVLLSTKQVDLTLQTGSPKTNTRVDHARITVGFIGSAAEAKLDGVDELAAKTNYLIGSDSTKWLTGVRTFSKVRYTNVYPRIDLLFYGTGREIEYDLVVHPGVNPNQIRFSIKGETTAAIEASGALALSTQVGTIRFRVPLVYQQDGDSRKTVGGHFRLVAANDGQKELTLDLDSYDRSRTLIIDPVLDYSTYLGGSGADWASGIAVDNAGNAYVTGTTASLDFPVTPGAAFQINGGCSGYCYDAFVAKINTTGKGLIYATYLGGSSEDFGNAIAIDSSGNAYIAGTTGSTDFPTTPNALQRSCGGTCFNHDAFVTKLNANGSALLYSTYLGGSDEDAASGIAVSNNNAYVSGFSGSTDFPLTPGTFQTTMQGQGSSFVVQLNSAASSEIFGTFLGEVDLYDAGGSIVLDAAGNSYVAGNTLSANFPVTSGAFHTAFLSGLTSNLYILKLNSTGTSLAYSALIGGATPGGIAIDTAGNAYVAASAGSFFPVTPGAIDQSCSNGVLLLKLASSGSSLLTAAHVCPDRLSPVGVAIDPSQNFIFAGDTDSTALPSTVGAFRVAKTNQCCFTDDVLGKVSADGSAILYLTYFGGNGGDSPNAIAEDSAGNVYVAGFTDSTNLPIKNGVQTAYAGSGDVFLAKFSLPAPRLSVSPAVLTFPSQGVGIASPTLEITAANASASTVAMSNVAASGDFSVSRNGCGTAVPSKSHCVIAIDFKPTASGKRIGTLTLTDGAGTQKVSLAGQGISGPLVVFPAALQINSAPGLFSPPFPVTITNFGNEPLTVTQISLTNGPNFSFYGSTNCFKPIPSLGTCTVDLVYYGAGQEYAALSFSDNAAGSPQGVGITGTTVGSGLVFTTPGVRFGQQPVGLNSAAQQVALINATGSPVTISSIKGSGNFSQSHTCGRTLAVGAYCYVKVSFKPTSLGIKQGTVSVTSSASGTPLLLPLIGTGD